MRHAGLSAYDQSFAPDLPVEFLDTAGFGFLEITIPESRFTANPEEADFLLKHLAQLLEPYEQTALCASVMVACSTRGKSKGAPL